MRAVLLTGAGGIDKLELTEVPDPVLENPEDILVRLPEATEGADRGTSPQLVVINVRESRMILVDQRVMSADELETYLRDARESYPDLVAVLRCDRHAYHKHFVRVLNLCERIGVNAVAVATFKTGQ